MFTNEVITPVTQDVRTDSIINILHDHSFLITMSPIVTRHKESDRELATGKVTYNVWENIVPFKLFNYEIEFKCAFQDKPDGVISWIEAPMGFTSKADYTVGPEGVWDGGGNVIEEQIESNCNVLLKPFVEWTMVGVRRKMHLEIIAKAREMARGVES
ncbi:hypothetical protein LTR15_005435 [Elasticomyces elasticus]|nr:hypothetical protein LTR15_005435 [Elasticomyces elasticus]